MLCVHGSAKHDNWGAADVPVDRPERGRHLGGSVPLRMFYALLSTSPPTALAVASQLGREFGVAPNPARPVLRNMVPPRAQWRAASTALVSAIQFLLAALRPIIGEWPLRIVGWSAGTHLALVVRKAASTIPEWAGSVLRPPPLTLLIEPATPPYLLLGADHGQITIIANADDTLCPIQGLPEWHDDNIPAWINLLWLGTMSNLPVPGLLAGLFLSSTQHGISDFATPGWATMGTCSPQLPFQGRARSTSSN